MKNIQRRKHPSDDLSIHHNRDELIRYWTVQSPSILQTLWSKSKRTPLNWKSPSLFLLSPRLYSKQQGMLKPLSQLPNKAGSLQARWFRHPRNMRAVTHVHASCDRCSRFVLPCRKSCARRPLEHSGSCCKLVSLGHSMMSYELISLELRRWM